MLAWLPPAMCRAVVNLPLLIVMITMLVWKTLAILKLVANTLQLIVMIITTNDYCDISSGCEHVPVVCNDHSQCTNKSCDPDMCLYSDIVQR